MPRRRVRCEPDGGDLDVLADVEIEVPAGSCQPSAIVSFAIVGLADKGNERPQLEK
jgi:hypothetical protein